VKGTAATLCTHLQKKSVINMIWLLVSVSELAHHHNDSSRWFAISSQSPTYLLFPFQFYRWGCKIVNVEIN
jgi:hypothetical protein